MRPIEAIDPEFLEFDSSIPENLPLLDALVSQQRDRQPLAGYTVFLVQHQLANQVPMVKALIDLGVNAGKIHWLDIPYTAHHEVCTFVQNEFNVPSENFSDPDYRALDPYVPYQRRRALECLQRFIDDPPEKLLVLDDGAYFLEALSSIHPGRRPARIAIVEQTTRGLIKMQENAALRATGNTVPIVNVAGSVPKRILEPPFIAMAICASLKPHLDDHFAGGGRRCRCLILGYGSIGEQVASFVRRYFGLERDQVYVYDTDSRHIETARDRGFKWWDSEDLNTRFDLVIGCSGRASFKVGDYAYLEDGALLASASSGVVELSRRDFIDLADVSDIDDIEIDRARLDNESIHTDLHFRLVDRTAIFVNAGFPVNFDGRITVVPTRYIQPTPTMMVQAAIQAVATSDRGLVELDPQFCDWVDGEFRTLLGEKASWLIPPPDEAW